MHIKVEFSEAALFGPADITEINVEASANRFAEAMTNHLCAAYPGAEIEVIRTINDRCTVDGQTDHEEVPWIEQAIERVWTGDDWLEYN